MRGLTDKRVLVTGGASGIGQATVQRFVEEGAAVAIFDRDSRALEKTLAEIPQVAKGVTVDVSDDRAVAEAFRELDEVFPAIDILINNAGISVRHESFRSITPAQWRQVLNTNLNGAFYVASETVRRMDHGVVINQSSINGLAAFPHYADYNASKAALLALSRTMAVELAPQIRVIALCPGAVLTPMQRAEYTDEMFQQVNDNIPLGRHADPEEIARFLAFLASDDARFITGQHYIIDGGETARAAL
ncbi:SDR family NAD(P)-dependent oxidoreductase [Actinoplanes utahensis]|uniref:Oxidoreductase n=1 Tax=Actinoplanes utahensis TaxID=1869 RepID=A0A0A6UIG2_ACTUT|nr:SDR family oxidoreductase [Actinoplanes utahensis]KHD75226.1 oxidoreductase [Actinoplanes utahensis]GIF28399.1 short-chain dehydrogenase [Actinoplanes utahensis]